jgi:CheY-like chemotaxis protein
MTKALRILVVEDDDMVSMLLGEMLREMGHEVCASAATEADAVIDAAWHRPDLIVIDAGLRHQGSGLGAVDKILLAGFVPHVFMSGDVAKVRALRPDAILLEKPFQEAQLARAIQQALQPADAL